MAQNGQIRYQVNFDVNTAGLKKIDQAFKKIQNLSPGSLSNNQMTNIQNMGQSFQGLKVKVLEYQKAFQNSMTAKGPSYSKFLQNIGGQQGLSQMQAEFQALGSAGVNAGNQLSASFASFRMNAERGVDVLGNLGASLRRVAQYQLSTRMISAFIGSIQTGINYVNKLDEALTNIQIVTGKSSEEMAKFAKNAQTAAKSLSVSTVDYTKASLIYYQQGLSDKEATSRAKTTVKASHVTGQSTDAVSEQLTAVWNGYNVQMDQTQQYVDKLAAVASKSASNLAELSTGMSKVASTASSLGVNVDQLSAQIATIISTTRQAPESVGTALKTIYARMSDIKSGLDGETSLGNYTSKLAAMGVNVLDTAGNLRDMGAVIEEVGGKWSSYTRQQQIALAQTMAGTRQYNNMIALFDNWGKYQSSLQTAQGAAGTLDKQNAIYENSIAGKKQKLATTAEGIYQNFYDQQAVGNMYDSLTKLTQGINTVVKGLGGFETILNSIKAIGIGFAVSKLGTVGSDILAKRQDRRMNDQIVNMRASNVRAGSDRLASLDTDLRRQYDSNNAQTLLLAQNRKQLKLTPEQLNQRLQGTDKINAAIMKQSEARSSGREQIAKAMRANGRTVSDEEARRIDSGSYLAQKRAEYNQIANTETRYKQALNRENPPPMDAAALQSKITEFTGYRTMLENRGDTAGANSIGQAIESLSRELTRLQQGGADEAVQEVADDVVEEQRQVEQAISNLTVENATINNATINVTSTEQQGTVAPVQQPSEVQPRQVEQSQPDVPKEQPKPEDGRRVATEQDKRAFRQANATIAAQEQRLKSGKNTAGMTRKSESELRRATEQRDNMLANISGLEMTTVKPQDIVQKKSNISKEQRESIFSGAKNISNTKKKDFNKAADTYDKSKEQVDSLKAQLSAEGLTDEKKQGLQAQLAKAESTLAGNRTTLFSQMGKMGYKDNAEISRLLGMTKSGQPVSVQSTEEQVGNAEITVQNANVKPVEQKGGDQSAGGQAKKEPEVKPQPQAPTEQPKPQTSKPPEANKAPTTQPTPPVQQQPVVTTSPTVPVPQAQTEIPIPRSSSDGVPLTILEQARRRREAAAQAPEQPVTTPAENPNSVVPQAEETPIVENEGAVAENTGALQALTDAINADTEATTETTTQADQDQESAVQRRLKSPEYTALSDDEKIQYINDRLQKAQEEQDDALDNMTARKTTPEKRKQAEDTYNQWQGWKGELNAELQRLKSQKPAQQQSTQPQQQQSTQPVQQQPAQQQPAQQQPAQQQPAQPQQPQPAQQSQQENALSANTEATQALTDALNNEQQETEQQAAEAQNAQTQQQPQGPTANAGVVTQATDRVTDALSNATQASGAEMAQASAINQADTQAQQQTLQAQQAQAIKDAEMSLQSYKKAWADLGRSVASAGMAINQIKNLGGIWSNEDVGTGEKILQTVMTLGTAVPMLTSAAKGFKGAMTSFSTGKQLAQTSSTAMTAATTASTGAMVAETGAAAADAAAQGRVTTAQGGATVSTQGHAVASGTNTAAMGAETAAAGVLGKALKALSSTPAMLIIAALIAAIGVLMAYKKAVEQAHKKEIAAAKSQEETIAKQSASIKTAAETTTSYQQKLSDLNKSWEQGTITQAEYSQGLLELSQNLDAADAYVLALTGDVQTLNERMSYKIASDYEKSARDAQMVMRQYESSSGSARVFRAYETNDSGLKTQKTTAAALLGESGYQFVDIVKEIMTVDSTNDVGDQNAWAKSIFGENDSLTTYNTFLAKQFGLISSGSGVLIKNIEDLAEAYEKMEQFYTNGTAQQRAWFSSNDKLMELYSTIGDMTATYRQATKTYADSAGSAYMVNNKKQISTSLENNQFDYQSLMQDVLKEMFGKDGNLKNYTSAQIKQAKTLIDTQLGTYDSKYKTIISAGQAAFSQAQAIVNKYKQLQGKSSSQAWQWFTTNFQHLLDNPEFLATVNIDTINYSYDGTGQGNGFIGNNGQDLNTALLQQSALSGLQTAVAAARTEIATGTYNPDTFIMSTYKSLYSILSQEEALALFGYTTPEQFMQNYTSMNEGQQLSLYQNILDLLTDAFFQSRYNSTLITSSDTLTSAATSVYQKYGIRYHGGTQTEDFLTLTSQANREYQAEALIFKAVAGDMTATNQQIIDALKIISPSAAAIAEEAYRGKQSQNFVYSNQFREQILNSYLGVAGNPTTQNLRARGQSAANSSAQLQQDMAAYKLLMQTAIGNDNIYSEGVLSLKRQSQLMRTSAKTTIDKITSYYGKKAYEYSLSDITFLVQQGVFSSADQFYALSDTQRDRILLNNYQRMTKRAGLTGLDKQYAEQQYKKLAEQQFTTEMNNLVSSIEAQKTAWEKVRKSADSVVSLTSKMMSNLDSISYQQIAQLSRTLQSLGISAEKTEDIINRMLNPEQGGNTAQILALMEAQTAALLAKLGTYEAEFKSTAKLEIDTEEAEQEIDEFTEALLADEEFLAALEIDTSQARSQILAIYAMVDALKTNLKNVQVYDTGAFNLQYLPMSGQQVQELINRTDTVLGKGKYQIEFEAITVAKGTNLFGAGGILEGYEDFFIPAVTVRNSDYYKLTEAGLRNAKLQKLLLDNSMSFSSNSVKVKTQFEEFAGRADEVVTNLRILANKDGWVIAVKTSQDQQYQKFLKLTEEKTQHIELQIQTDGVHGIFTVLTDDLKDFEQEWGKIFGQIDDKIISVMPKDNNFNWADFNNWIADYKDIVTAKYSDDGGFYFTYNKKATKAQIASFNKDLRTTYGLSSFKSVGLDTGVFDFDNYTAGISGLITMFGLDTENLNNGQGIKIITTIALGQNSMSVNDIERTTQAVRQLAGYDDTTMSVTFTATGDVVSVAESGIAAILNFRDQMQALGYTANITGFKLTQVQGAAKWASDTVDNYIGSGWLTKNEKTGWYTIDYDDSSYEGDALRARQDARQGFLNTYFTTQNMLGENNYSKYIGIGQTTFKRSLGDNYQYFPGIAEEIAAISEQDVVIDVYFNMHLPTQQEYLMKTQLAFAVAGIQNEEIRLSDDNKSFTSIASNLSYEAAKSFNAALKKFQMADKYRIKKFQLKDSGLASLITSSRYAELGTDGYYYVDSGLSDELYNQFLNLLYSKENEEKSSSISYAYTGAVGQGAGLTMQQLLGMTLGDGTNYDDDGPLVTVRVTWDANADGGIIKGYTQNENGLSVKGILQNIDKDHYLKVNGDSLFGLFSVANEKLELFYTTMSALSDNMTILPFGVRYDVMERDKVTKDSLNQWLDSDGKNLSKYFTIGIKQGNLTFDLKPSITGKQEIQNAYSELTKAAAKDKSMEFMWATSTQSLNDDAKNIFGNNYIHVSVDLAPIDYDALQTQFDEQTKDFVLTGLTADIVISHNAKTATEEAQSDVNQFVNDLKSSGVGIISLKVDDSGLKAFLTADASEVQALDAYMLMYAPNAKKIFSGASSESRKKRILANDDMFKTEKAEDFKAQFKQDIINMGGNPDLWEWTMQEDRQVINSETGLPETVYGDWILSPKANAKITAAQVNILNKWAKDKIPKLKSSYYYTADQTIFPKGTTIEYNFSDPDDTYRTLSENIQDLRNIKDDNAITIAYQFQQQGVSPKQILQKSLWAALANDWESLEYQKYLAGQGASDVMVGWVNRYVNYLMLQGQDATTALSFVMGILSSYYDSVITKPGPVTPADLLTVSGSYAQEGSGETIATSSVLAAETESRGAAIIDQFALPYAEAVTKYNAGRYLEALDAFKAISGYAPDSQRSAEDYLQELYYRAGVDLYINYKTRGDRDIAIEYLRAVADNGYRFDIDGDGDLDDEKQTGAMISVLQNGKNQNSENFLLGMQAYGRGDYDAAMKYWKENPHAEWKAKDEIAAATAIIDNYGLGQAELSNRKYTNAYAYFSGVSDSEYKDTALLLEYSGYLVALQQAMQSQNHIGAHSAVLDISDLIYQHPELLDLVLDASIWVSSMEQGQPSEGLAQKLNQYSVLLKAGDRAGAYQIAQTFTEDEQAILNSIDPSILSSMPKSAINSTHARVNYGADYYERMGYQVPKYVTVTAQEYETPGQDVIEGIQQQLWDAQGGNRDYYISPLSSADLTIDAYTYMSLAQTLLQLQSYQNEDGSFNINNIPQGSSLEKTLKYFQRQYSSIGDYYAVQVSTLSRTADVLYPFLYESLGYGKFAADRLPNPQADNLDYTAFGNVARYIAKKHPDITAGDDFLKSMVQYALGESLQQQDGTEWRQRSYESMNMNNDSVWLGYVQHGEDADISAVAAYFAKNNTELKQAQVTVDALVTAYKLIYGAEGLDSLATGLEYSGINMTAWLQEKFLTNSDFVKIGDGGQKQFTALGKFIIEGFLRGLNYNNDEIAQIMLNMCQAGADTVTDFFIIQSPSRLMYTFGRFVVQGFAKGIKENAKLAYDAFDTFLQHMDQAMAESLVKMTTLSDGTQLFTLGGQTLLTPNGQYFKPVTGADGITTLEFADGVLGEDGAWDKDFAAANPAFVAYIDGLVDMSDEVIAAQTALDEAQARLAADRVAAYGNTIKGQGEGLEKTKANAEEAQTKFEQLTSTFETAAQALAISLPTSAKYIIGRTETVTDLGIVVDRDITSIAENPDYNTELAAARRVMETLQTNLYAGTYKSQQDFEADMRQLAEEAGLTLTAENTAAITNAAVTIIKKESNVGRAMGKTSGMATVDEINANLAAAVSDADAAYTAKEAEIKELEETTIPQLADALNNAKNNTRKAIAENIGEMTVADMMSYSNKKSVFNSDALTAYQKAMLYKGTEYMRKTYGEGWADQEGAQVRLMQYVQGIYEETYTAINQTLTNIKNLWLTGLQSMQNLHQKAAQELITIWENNLNALIALQKGALQGKTGIQSIGGNKDQSSAYIARRLRQGVSMETIMDELTSVKGAKGQTIDYAATAQAKANAYAIANPGIGYTQTASGLYVPKTTSFKQYETDYAEEVARYKKQFTTSIPKMENGKTVVDKSTGEPVMTRDYSIRLYNPKTKGYDTVDFAKVYTDALTNLGVDKTFWDDPTNEGKTQQIKGATEQQYALFQMLGLLDEEHSQKDAATEKWTLAIKDNVTQSTDLLFDTLIANDKAFFDNLVKYLRGGVKYDNETDFTQAVGDYYASIIEDLSDELKTITETRKIIEGNYTSGIKALQTAATAVSKGESGWDALDESSRTALQELWKTQGFQNLIKDTELAGKSLWDVCQNSDLLMLALRYAAEATQGYADSMALQQAAIASGYFVGQDKDGKTVATAAIPTVVTSDEYTEKKIASIVGEGDNIVAGLKQDMLTDGSYTFSIDTQSETQVDEKVIQRLAQKGIAVGGYQYTMQQLQSWNLLQQEVIEKFLTSANNQMAAQRESSYAYGINEMQTGMSALSYITGTKRSQSNMSEWMSNWEVVRAQLREMKVSQAQITAFEADMAAGGEANYKKHIGLINKLNSAFVNAAAGVDKMSEAQWKQWKQMARQNNITKVGNFTLQQYIDLVERVRETTVPASRALYEFGKSADKAWRDVTKISNNDADISVDIDFNQTGIDENVAKTAQSMQALRAAALQGSDEFNTEWENQFTSLAQTSGMGTQRLLEVKNDLYGALSGKDPQAVVRLQAEADTSSLIGTASVMQQAYLKLAEALEKDGQADAAAAARAVAEAWGKLGVDSTASSGVTTGDKKGGGGGGGGGGKARSFIEKDPYHDVNNTIEELTHSLELLQEQQEKVMGADLTKNLKEQLELMKKQNEQYALKLKIAQQVAEQQAKEMSDFLSSAGAQSYAAQVMGLQDKDAKKLQKNLDTYFAGQFEFQINADGYVDVDNLALLEKQWDETLQKIYTDFGGIGMSKAKQEEYDKIVAYIQKVQEYAKKADETASTMREVEKTLQTQAYSIIDTKVKSFKLLSDTISETSEAYKTFNKYQSSVLSGLSKDSKLATAMQSFANLNSMIDMNEIDAYSNYIEKLSGIVETLSNGGTSDIYSTTVNGKTYSDAATALSDLSDMLKNAQELGTTLKEDTETMLSNWSEQVTTVSESYETLASSIEAVEKQLEHEQKLVELIYGEDSYKQQNQYLAQQVNEAQKRIDVYKQQRDMWARELREALTMMNDYEAGSMEAEAFKSVVEEAQKGYKDALSSINEVIETEIENIKTLYTNTIESIAADLESALTDTLGYDWLSTEWDMLKENPFDMFDSIDAEFALEKIRNEYEKTINEIDNKKIQNELKDLLESQLSTLEEQGYVSQYNLDYAEKLLAVKKAQAELEDAQANKSSLRLRRDSQGNYVYEYTTDSDAILEKQQALRDAQQEFYDWARDQQTEYLSTMVTQWTDAVEKIKTLYSEFTNGKITKEAFNSEAQSLMSIAATAIEQGLNMLDNNELGLDFAMNMDLQALGLSSATDMGGIITALVGDRETALAEFVNKLRNNDYGTTEDLIANDLIKPMQQALEGIIDTDNVDSMLSLFLAEMGISTEDLLNGLGTSEDDYSMLESIISNDKTALDYQNQQLTSIKDIMTKYMDTLEAIKPGLQHMNTNIINGFKMYAATQKDNAIAYTGEAFDTGGYTGSWGSEGKLAMLHQKELILNASDTANMLDAVKLVRGLENFTYTDLATQMASVESSISLPALAEAASALDQNVHIEANFPNVSTSSEIRAALNNLVNTAAQRAMKKR